MGIQQYNAFSMHISILSRAFNLYSTQSLYRAGFRRGHKMEVIDHQRCNLIIEKNLPQVYFEGRRINDVDAIIPRVGASVTSYGATVIKQFELMNVFTSTRSDALLQSRDKLRSLQKLSTSDIGVPKTIIVNNLEDLPQLIRTLGPPPFVIKLLEGTHGAGVILAESTNAAISIVEAFHKINQKVLVQEFIEEASGADIRAIVVGGKVVATMKRQAPKGEFRSNLHRGATAIPIILTEEEEKIVKKSARLMGLDVAGVDLLQSKRGPLIMEVNASPGLEGIEATTRVDVAGEIIDFVVQKVKKISAYQREQRWKVKR